MSIRKAIILDRDGVLIEDKNYSYKVEDLEVLPGVIEGLKEIQENYFFFYSDQSIWYREKLLYIRRLPQI